MSLLGGNEVRGVLLDVTGVLYESSERGGHAITGSVDAIKKLRAAGLPIRFCSNDTTTTRLDFIERLRRLGFELKVDEVFLPVPAVCHLLRERNLRPHLLVQKEVLPDFSSVDTSEPNCVVIGFAGEGFNNENLNHAFNTLMSLDNPLLISLGKGRYYKENDRLNLDVGSFTKTLEYACEIEAEIVGKPSPSFFKAALSDMNLSAHQVVMVGDDAENDIGGALACGMRGILVRTGKYRPIDESNCIVTPTAVAENLAEAVQIILKRQ